MNWRWMFRQLKADLRRTQGPLRSSILLLSLASFSLVLILGFQSSARSALAAKSRAILGGDLKISAFHPFSPAELENFQNFFHPSKISEVADLRTMLSTKTAQKTTSTVFVRVFAVDGDYPLVGDFKAESQNLSTESLQVNPQVWLSREAAERLNLSRDSTLKIGEAAFEVAAVLDEDPSQLQSSFSAAPRIYIGRHFLEATGLTGLGSQVHYSLLFELSSESKTRIEDFKKLSESSDLYILSPQESLESFQENSENFESVVRFLSFFLVFLSLMSAFHQWASHFRNQISNSQILLCFGASRRSLYRLYGLEIFFVQILASLFSLILCQLIFSLTNWSLRKSTYQDLVLRLGWNEILWSLGFCLLLTLGFIFHFRQLLKTASPARLLQESSDSIHSDLRLFDLWLPVLLASLSGILIFRSLVLALVTSLSLLILAALASLLAKYFLGHLATRDQNQLRRLRWTQLSRPRLSMTLMFSMIFLLSLLFSSLTFVLATFESQISPRQDQPDLFVFNVPEEELQNLESFVKEKEARFENLSPMVLARVLEKNGAKLEDKFFNRFPVRLTFRKGLFSSEKNIAGPGLPNHFSWTSSETIPLSVEERYAKRRGLKLGDQLKIDVLGLSLLTQITSLRRIDWLEFHPNFFLQLPPGVLDDAPKTYLASIYANSKIKAQSLIIDLTEKFPTISVIDIRQTIQDLRSVMDRIRWILGASFLVAAIIIFLLISGLLAQNLQQRQQEMKIFNLFGLDSSSVKTYFIKEYMTLVSIASSLGFLGAILIANFISQRLFYSWSQIDFISILGGFFLMQFFTYLLVSYFFERSSRLKANSAA